MENLDNRVRYTKMAFREALLRILAKKNIDRVSVKELCEEAKVNRGTFYLHYATPNDILREIEQDFIDEKMSFFSPYLRNTQETDQLAGLFTSILKNKELCQIIMGPHGSPRFVDRLKETMREQIVSGWCKEFPNYKRAHLDYIYDFVFAGSMRLILNWIADDHGLSTAELANRLDRLGHYCHLAIAEFREG